MLSVVVGVSTITVSLKFCTSLYILIDSVDIVTTSGGVGVTVMSGKTHSFVYYHAPQTKLVTSKCHSAHTPASEVKMSPPAGARDEYLRPKLHKSGLAAAAPSMYGVCVWAG